MKMFISITLQLILITNVFAQADTAARNNLADTVSYHKLYVIDATTKNSRISRYAHIYVTDTNARKFIGTWRWKHNDTILTLRLTDSVIKRGSMKGPGSFDMETLGGSINYAVNNSGGGKAITYHNRVEGATYGQPLIVYIEVPETTVRTASFWQTCEYQLSFTGSNSAIFLVSTRRREWFKNGNYLQLPVGVILYKK
jgi:hypothetical protein